MSSTTSRDRALRALHLSTGALTVAALGATGALTGALAAAPPAAPTPPSPTAAPMPRVTVHRPATPASQPPVVTSGAS